MRRLRDRGETVTTGGAFELVGQHLELRLIMRLDRGADGGETIVQLGKEFLDQLAHARFAEQRVKLRAVRRNRDMLDRSRPLRDFAQVILQNLQKLVPLDWFDGEIAAAGG